MDDSIFMATLNQMTWTCLYAESFNLCSSQDSCREYRIQILNPHKYVYLIIGLLKQMTFIQEIKLNNEPNGT